MKSRVVLTVAAAAFLCAHVVAASPDAPAGPAAAPEDPWAIVPPLPTACYRTPEVWDDQNNSAIDAERELFYAQQEKNTAIDKQLTRAERRLHASLKSLAILRRLRRPVVVAQLNVASGPTPKALAK